MKKDVLKLIKKTTSVVLAGVMTGGGTAVAASAAPLSGTQKTFSMGRIGTVLDNVKDLIAGNTPVKKDTHKTADTFSSKRLIVKADKLKNIDKENVIASYDGYYLLSYDSSSAAKKAYVLYSAKANGKSAIAADQPVHMSTGNADAGGLTNVTKKNNPLAELKDNVSDITKAEVKKAEKKKVIALLDTGASKSSNVIESVSMLGGSGADDNGHGEAMVKAITKENKKAQIISIKVLDKNGEGSVSSIVSGIAYAEKRGASIVNLSLSGLATQGNVVVTTAVNDAIRNGMIVVGAAGNNAGNAKNYIPGSISEAIIVGACDSKGKRIASSNYGDTVDYNAVANSTSEAAAMMSGYLSANMNKDGSYEINTDGKGPFFNQENDETGDASKENAIINNTPADKTKRVLIRYLIVDDQTLTKDSTVDSVMFGNDMGVQSTLLTYAYPHKMADGKYKIIANAPFFNGVKSDGPVNAEFANANDDGEAITKGVSFNNETGIATVSENVFKKSDFGDLQMEVLIPAKSGAKANVVATIENEKGKVIDQTFSQESAFLPSALKINAESANSIKKSDINVYIDGDNTALPQNAFTYDPHESTISTGIPCGAMNNVRIRIKNIRPSEKFTAQWYLQAGKAQVPGYWLSASANSNGEFENDNMPVGWKVNCKVKTTHKAGAGMESAYKNLPDEYFDKFADGGKKVWEQGDTIGTIQVPTEVKKNGITYDFRLYKKKGAQDPIGIKNGFLDPFDAYCFHIITPAAKRASGEVDGSIRVLDRFLYKKGDKRVKKSDVKTSGTTQVIVFGVRESNDTYGETTGVGENPSKYHVSQSWKGLHQHQGAIFAVMIHKPNYQSAKVSKTWSADDHPAEAHFQLKCSSSNLDTEGKKIVKKYDDVTLNAKNKWTYTTKDELPEVDSKSKYVYYYWREIKKPSGWKVSYKDKHTTNYTSCTNKSNGNDTSVTKEFEGFEGTDARPTYHIVNGQGKLEEIAIDKIGVQLAYKHDVKDTNGKVTDVEDKTETHLITPDKDGDWDTTITKTGDDHDFTWTEISWHREGEGDVWHLPSEIPNCVITYENEDGSTVIHNAKGANPVYTSESVDKSWLLGTAYASPAVDSVDVKLYRSVPGGAEEPAKDISGNEVTFTLSDANNWSASTSENSLPAYNTENSIPPDDNPEAAEYTYVWREVPNSAKYAGKDFSSIIEAVDETDSDVTNHIKSPSLSTYAVSFTTGVKAGAEKTDETVHDTVSLNNLSPRHNYTLYAEVRRKSTNDVIGSSNKTFTPNAATINPGVAYTETIDIPVNTSGAKNDDIVVFETLADNSASGVWAAGEYDINDTAQTVHIPELKTHMVSDNPLEDLAHKYDGTFDTDGKHYGATAESETDRRITMTDTVSYKNLASGTYVVRGELHRKDRNSETDFGVVATSESDKFDINVGDGATSGTSTVKYSFNYTDEMFGSDFVSYEKLYYVGNNHNSELTSHADINDKSQTVRMPTRIRIVKKDQETGKPQAHAMIGLYTKDSDGSLKEYMHNGKHYVLETDDNGIALFCNLDPGEYWFKELQSSDAHNEMASSFKVNAEYYKTRQMVLDEQKTVELATGGQGTKIFYIASAVAAIIACVSYVIFKRRQSKD